MELKRYLEIIWRRRQILFQAIGVIVGCAVFVSSCVTTIYNSSAKVLIKTEDLKARYFSVGPLSTVPPDLGFMNYIEQRNAVDTYIALAQVSPVLAQAIRELKLKDQKGKIIDVKDFIISIPRFPKLIFKQKKGVKIKRLKASEVLEITGYSTDRQEAVKIANSVAGAFSDLFSDLWRQEASSVRRVIEKQMYQIELFSYFAEVWRKQEGLRYRQRNLFVEGESKNLTQQEPQEPAGIKKGVFDLDEQVSGLVLELADLELKKSTLQKSFQEAFKGQGITKIDSLKEQINVLSQQIDQKTEEIILMLKSFRKSPRFMSRLSTLGETYNYLKTRLEYVKIAEAIDVSNVVTVQPATLSEYPGNDKYFPKKGSILVMSLLLSMSFGIFLCFLLEYLDDTIKTTPEINENLNQPVLGVVRMITGKKIQDREELSAGFYDDFWDIRSNIKMATLDKGYKMLAVMSGARGEGKSTISRSLAQIFVESGQKVLLIDLNFRRPFLHKMLNLPNAPGLADFLNGEKKIRDIIFSIKKEGVDFIPAGNISSNPLKMIDSLNMLRFMQSIRTDYDVIICDTPAIEDGSDCSVIGSFVDDIIFVVGLGEVSQFHLKKALEILGKANANLLGVVLNKAVK